MHKEEVYHTEAHPFLQKIYDLAKIGPN